MNNPINDTLSGLAGRRVPGGCGHCDAYQELARDPDHPSVWLLAVFHDDDCPALATR